MSYPVHCKSLMFDAVPAELQGNLYTLQQEKVQAKDSTAYWQTLNDHGSRLIFIALAPVFALPPVFASRCPYTAVLIPGSPQFNDFNWANFKLFQKQFRER